tara:strand:- start:580 stop:1299 length:720 start_codon:yes stop_codon:yes gene_type:complete
MLNSSVAILCRGSSLENIDLLPDVEEYVIVNGFADELKIEKVKNKIKDKPISHVMSLSVMSHPHRWNNSAAGSQFDAMIRDKFYQNFDVKRIVLPYIAECLPDDYIKIKNQNIRNKDFKLIDTLCLGDEHKPYMISHPRYPFTYPSSGMDTLGWATIELKKKNIFIIGMDFYEADYLAKELEIPQDRLEGHCLPEGEQLKQFLPGFLSEFPETNFNFYTYGNLDIDLDNVTINKLSQEK